jgi:hypothetical protein
MEFLTSPLYSQELKKSLLARISLEKPELLKELEEQEKIIIEESEKEKSP